MTFKRKHYFYSLFLSIKEKKIDLLLDGLFCRIGNMIGNLYFRNSTIRKDFQLLFFMDYLKPFSSSSFLNFKLFIV